MAENHKISASSLHTWWYDFRCGLRRESGLNGGVGGDEERERGRKAAITAAMTCTSKENSRGCDRDSGELRAAQKARRSATGWISR